MVTICTVIWGAGALLTLLVLLRSARNIPDPVPPIVFVVAVFAAVVWPLLVLWALVDLVVRP